MRKQKNPQDRKFKRIAIEVGMIVAVIALVAHFGLSAMTPVNSKVPVFAARGNTYLKATHSAQTGYVFSSQSITSGKKSISGSHINPEVHVFKGEVESIHMINEDKETNSKHNINIDEFNVHSRDLGYFESQTIDFVADKEGTFHYYCTIHPEMNGTLTVE
ncbi:MAG TPA: cupredoxin domain-containing protein [Nitrosopumilaceae archaeon]|nr:cupredoxin domain-containing protein [Nitrosopumilaceae archaeon]